LGTDSLLPPDVTFLVWEGDNVHPGIRKIERFRGHRCLLGSVSSVFKAQFFGGLRDGNEEIEITDATIVGFSGLMKFVYSKPHEKLAFFKERSFRELFEILYLAKKYLIDSFITMMTDLISTKEIPHDNIIEVANVAETFHHFGDVSQNLFQRTSNKIPCVIKNLDSLKKIKSTVKTEDRQLFYKMIAFIEDRSAVMSCISDWSIMLKEDSIMPPDVKFVVLKSFSGISGRVYPAHRFLLALASPVLKAQFYGDEKEMLEVEATYKGFEGFLKFVYVSECTKFFEARSFQELFEILTLAKNYIVYPLIDKITGLVSTKMIFHSDIMKVAHVADHYSHFGEVSHTLLQKCSDKLVEVIKDFGTLKNFQSKLAKNDGDLFLKMIGMTANNLIPSPVKCTGSNSIFPCTDPPSKCATHIPTCKEYSCNQPPTMCSSHTPKSQCRENSCNQRPSVCYSHAPNCQASPFCGEKPTLCSSHTPACSEYSCNQPPTMCSAHTPSPKCSYRFARGRGGPCGAKGTVVRCPYHFGYDRNRRYPS